VAESDRFWCRAGVARFSSRENGRINGDRKCSLTLFRAKGRVFFAELQSGIWSPKLLDTGSRPVVGWARDKVLVGVGRAGGRLSECGRGFGHSEDDRDLPCAGEGAHWRSNSSGRQNLVRAPLRLYYICCRRAARTVGPRFRDYRNGPGGKRHNHRTQWKYLQSLPAGLRRATTPSSRKRWLTSAPAVKPGADAK